MSTRATYQFENGKTIYVHYDGYPSGAAGYFSGALEHYLGKPDDVWCQATGRGGWYFNFIRAVPFAEPTDSHEAHGDTEYRYTLVSLPKGSDLDTFVQVHEVSYDRQDRKEWRGVFKGSIPAFINWGLLDGLKTHAAYTKANDLPFTPPVGLHEIIGDSGEAPEHHRRVVGSVQYLLELESALALQVESFDEKNPNKASLLQRLEICRSALKAAEEIWNRDFLPIIERARSREAERKSA